jgi:alpha-amylase
VEWNLMFLGGGGNPAAWYEIAGRHLPHDSAGEAAAVDAVASGNTDVGCLLRTAVSPAADAWWFPIDTISNSEAGFERVYQGSCLTFSWRVDLAPGAHFTTTVRHDLTATRDRAAEEADGPPG